MRVFFMGTPDFAAASLSAVLDAGFDVVGVFTQPDKPVGRKQILEAPPVKKLAVSRGVPVWQPKKLRDGTAAELIRSLKPDVIAVVAYGRILPKEILDIPPKGSINIHGSLLPKYRGSAPIQWAVINNEPVTGVTAMYMAEELDAGDMIEKREVPILPEETAGELIERLAPIGARLLCDTLQGIDAGTVTSVPQNEAEATFAPPLTRELAELDFSLPGALVASRVRGLDPWPVATAELAGVKFKIYKAYNTVKSVSAPPGTVISAGKQGIEVAVSDGSVTITRLQAPGGKQMAAADYLRGHPICV